MATVLDLPRTPTVLSGPLSALIAAVDALREQEPVGLPGPQALLETSVLLAELDRLKAVVLTRVADVDLRGLHDLDECGTTASWVAQQDSSVDRSDVALARRLTRLPALADKVAEGLPLAAARQIAAALGRLRLHTDRPDGLIDGHDAEQVLAAVIVDGVIAMLCEARGGLPANSPRLGPWRTELEQILARPAAQLDRLEAAFLVLAVHVEPGQLAPALGMLVDAVLPQQLQETSDRAHDRRSLQLTPHHGGGWTVRGELDDECGELLHTVLTASAATDPHNPTDTAGWAARRTAAAAAEDTIEWDSPDGCCGNPRSRRQQTHDALTLALRTLLDSSALGVRGKAVPHLDITIGIDTLHNLPGALPARGSSGNSLPLRLVQHEMCDSALTLFVLNLGRQVLETSHTQRTLKAHERRARRIETGGQCQGARCTRGPGTPLIPHHPIPWAICHTTSLRDTVPLCDQHHHHAHSGRPLQLKDGRQLGPTGWI